MGIPATVVFGPPSRPHHPAAARTPPACAWKCWRKATATSRPAAIPFASSRPAPISRAVVCATVDGHRGLPAAPACAGRLLVNRGTAIGQRDADVSVGLPRDRSRLRRSRPASAPDVRAVPQRLARRHPFFHRSHPRRRGFALQARRRVRPGMPDSRIGAPKKQTRVAETAARSWRHRRCRLPCLKATRRRRAPGRRVRDRPAAATLGRRRRSPALRSSPGAGDCPRRRATTGGRSGRRGARASSRIRAGSARLASLAGLARADVGSRSRDRCPLPREPLPALPPRRWPPL